MCLIILTYLYRYYVSEKTDGVRYLLFIGAPTQPLGSGVFLIDRAYTIYQVVKYEDPRVDLRSILAIQGDTLIDGEMVFYPLCVIWVEGDVC